MSRIDVHRALDAILKSEFLAGMDGRARTAKCPGCVVTLSRDCGSGGEHIGHLLAEALEVPFFDRELIELMGRETDVSTEMLERLDEHVASSRTEWLQAVISGRGTYSSRYRRALINAVLGIATTGGVIIGRGANFILGGRPIGGRPVLRLRVTGSAAMRYARIAGRHGLEAQQARSMTERIDAERAKFVQELFGRDINEPAAYDFTVNTDHFDEQSVVKLVLAARAAYVERSVSAPTNYVLP
ncbi:MAG: cytidylate kinase-like family protein [Chromatiales bacterium]|nr:cytidylate kinase-like family protein [Chromatiales bacterium]